MEIVIDSRFRLLALAMVTAAAALAAFRPVPLSAVVVGVLASAVLVTLSRRDRATSSRGRHLLSTLMVGIVVTGYVCLAAFESLVESPGRFLAARGSTASSSLDTSLREATTPVLVWVAVGLLVSVALTTLLGTRSITGWWAALATSGTLALLGALYLPATFALRMRLADAAVTEVPEAGTTGRVLLTIALASVLWFLATLARGALDRLRRRNAHLTTPIGV